MISYFYNSKINKMKLSDIDDIVQFIHNYIIDNNSQFKMTIASNKEINLLKIIKLKLNAENYGKNSLIYDDNIIIYIYYNNYKWHINIKNMNLIEPVGPI
jgi:hypothetical protein